MRITILFIFFASLFYYLKPVERPSVVDVDQIKVKFAAPKREVKTHTHRHMAHLPVQKTPVHELAQDLEETNAHIEENWEHSLQKRLMELDPIYGEEIFSFYKQEKDKYAGLLEKLVKEHQESDDLDHLIEELDFQHQQRLQDIFGPYFEDLQELQLSAQ